jgi:hypothetical protein
MDVMLVVYPISRKLFFATESFPHTCNFSLSIDRKLRQLRVLQLKIVHTDGGTGVSATCGRNVCTWRKIRQTYPLGMRSTFSGILY